MAELNDKPTGEFAASELRPPLTPPGPGGAQRVFWGSNGLRAGWRLLIYCVLIYVLVSALFGAFSWLARTIVLPAEVVDQSEAAGLLVNRGLLVVVLTVAGFIMSRIERRPLGAYGLPARQAFRGHFWEGVAWGFGSLSLMLLAMRVTGDFYFGVPALHGAEIAKWGGAWALAFLAVGVFEEMLFHGYPLITLGSGITFWPAMVVFCGVFAWAHINNPGENWIGLVAVAEFGVVLAYALWRTGTLWFAVGLHMGWDWGESFFYGVPDSGVTSPHHFLSPVLSNAKWITGGTVGPEGSVYLPVLLTLVLIGIHWRFRRRVYDGTAYGLR